MNSEHSKYIKIPILPLRDVVIYPYMVIPLFVGRKNSIKCIESAMNNDKKIMLIAQKEASTNEPTVKDLFNIGTISSILQILKLPDGTVKVLVEGLQRARIKNLTNNAEHFLAEVELIVSSSVLNKENEVLIRTTINQFECYIKFNKKIPLEILNTLNNIQCPEKLADTIAAHMPLKLKDKQSVLEINSIKKKIRIFDVNYGI